MSFNRYQPNTEMPFNRRAYTYVIEDYLSPTVPSWATNASAGGSLLQSGSVTNNTNIGVLGLYTGTTTTGRAALLTHVDAIQFGNNEWTFETRANVLNLSDATNAYTVRFGFMDASTGDPTDGYYFRYTHSVNGGKWEAVMRNNLLETFMDTGETVVAMSSGSPMPRFEIIVSKSGLQVTWKINDRVVATRNASTLTGSSRLTGIGYSIIKSAGTTTRPFFIDYTFFSCKLGTHR